MRGHSWQLAHSLTPKTGEKQSFYIVKGVQKDKCDFCAFFCSLWFTENKVSTIQQISHFVVLLSEILTFSCQRNNLYVTLALWAKRKSQWFSLTFKFKLNCNLEHIRQCLKSNAVENCFCVPGLEKMVWQENKVKIQYLHLERTDVWKIWNKNYLTQLIRLISKIQRHRWIQKW